MTTPQDQGPQADQQTHLDTDPVNQADPDRDADEHTDDDAVDDPAHDAGPDEGWASEGGANPTGPATDS